MPKPKKNESKQDYLKRCTAYEVEQGSTAKKAYAKCNIIWDEEKMSLSGLSLSSRPGMNLNIAPELLEKKGKAKPEFFITAYTGAIIDSWWRQIVLDIKGIETKEKIPVLREHMRDRVVGFGDAWKEKHFYISGEFSESTDDAKEVLALAKEGYPWQASVGVWAEEVEVLKDEKTKAKVNGKEVTGPMEIWRKSKVGEVSFVSLGADDNTAAITMSDKRNDVHLLPMLPTDKALTSENSNMINFGSTEKKTTKEEPMEITKELLMSDYPDLLAEIELAAEKKGREEGIAQERVRVVEILNSEGDLKIITTCVEEGTPSHEVWKQLFEAEKAVKATALEDLEASASASAGQEEDLTQTITKKDTSPPDVRLAKRSKEIMEEKQISIEEATQLALEADPKLAQEYSATFGVPE